MADNNNAQMPDINEQIKNRMDKLEVLQQEGKDPFEITSFDVTCHTDEIKADYDSFEGKEGYME